MSSVVSALWITVIPILLTVRALRVGRGRKVTVGLIVATLTFLSLYVLVALRRAGYPLPAAKFHAFTSYRDAYADGLAAAQLMVTNLVLAQLVSFACLVVLALVPVRQPASPSGGGQQVRLQAPSP
jgi:hypothetical protein